MKISGFFVKKEATKRNSSFCRLKISCITLNYNAIRIAVKFLLY